MNADDMNPKDTQKTHVTDASKPPVKPGALARFVLELVESKCTPETITDDQRTALLSESSAEMQGDFELLSITAWALAKQDATVAALAIPDILWGVLSIQPLPGWSIHWWQPFLLLDAVLTRNIDGILAALDVPSGGTNSQQEALRARIVALRSAIPRVKELFGSQHADAVLYILTPSFLPNQELRLISNNLWLLTEETVTGLETLAAETRPALDELIAPAIDRLTSLPPLNPRIQEAAMQGRMVLARLRERVITRVKELGPQDINTVLQALEQEPPLIHSEEVGGLLYVFVKEEQTTLEEVALTWLVWQQAMAAGMNSVQIAHSGWRLVDALSPWSEHPPVAERLLTVIDSALQHAHVLTDKILGLLHLEAADCFQVRFHHEGVPECWSAWFKHAEQAMEYARTGKDSVLFANARDTYVRARSEGHPPAHGLKNALTFLRDAIATDLQVEPFVTARAHFRLAHLLLNKNDSRVSEAELSESLYALRAAAKALAGSGDWPATRHGIASQLGSAEMLAHERGDREALGRAISALESALDIWTQQYIPPSLGNSIHLYLQALKQAGRSIDLRLHWVENALDRLPASSPPEVRAVLLLELAGLHKEQGLGPKPLHEWYGAAARDLDEAEGLIRSSSSLQKAELLVQLAEHHWRLHRHAERLDEGIAVLKRLLKGSDFASRPDLETTLRSQLLSLYFQRREGLDIRKAREELVAVLQHLGRSNCRVAVLDATEKALWFGSAQNPELDLMPMAKQLEEVIAHCEGASRMRLELIFDIWRSARTGQPSLDKVADRLVDMLEQCPQDEKWDWCNPGLTWLRQHLGNRDFRVRRVAHVMEALIFDTIPHLPATTSIRNLLRLAQLRTETGDLSLEQVSRGIRLLEAAEQLLREQPHCPAEMHLEVRRWSLDARTQRLGLTPGRPVEHVLREAEKLEAEARALPEPHSSTALELLPAMLYIVDTYEREKLKTAARALVRRLQAEGRTVPDFLTQHLKQDDARASTQRAQAEHAVPVCSEQDPCAQPADAESATRQFHKYLDEAWRIIQDGQYQPLQAFPKARALLEQARHLLDPSAIASELEWAHELGHLCWQWHPYAPDDGHRALGIQVLTGVLARPESAAHPSGRAALLRLLALLEPLGDSPLVMLPALNPEPLQRGIALLEEARTLAPTSAPALRFQILVTLGNLQRRLFEFSFGKRPALLECAIQAYEDANKIWEAAREARAWVPPKQGSYFLCLQRQLNKLDRGRLQKVRADALLLTNDPTRLEDARKLARSSAKMRRMGGDGLHAAESLLTLANIEAARLNAGHQDGLRGALDAIQEARGLITLEAAGPINAQLEALRLRLEQRASPGPTPPPQDPRRVEEAARERMKLLLKMMKKSGLEPPETMDEPLQFFEAQLRGEYARSPLAPHRRCMDDAIFHLKSRLNKTPSEAQALASELSRLETEARQGSDKRVAIDHTAFLMQLQVREGTLELENRAIALAERLLDAPLPAPLEWDVECMLADQAASVLIRHQPGLTERQATLAEAWFRRAISLLEPRHSTDPALSDQYNGMGMAIHHSPVHGRIGRWKEARDCYARALEIDRRRESRGGQAICLLNLAAILGEAADNTPDLRLEAVRCLEEAEQIQRDRQNPIMLMHVLLSLGFQRQGLSDAYQPEASLQAVRELEEALALSEGKTTWRKLRAMTLNNLGLAHHRLFTLENLSRTRWERAMDCYQQAVHLWREEADAFEEARSQQNIALLLARNGTEEGLWSALEILEKILVVRLRMPREAYETVTAIQRLMLLLEPMIPTPLLLMRMTPVIERCLERLWFVGLVGPALQLEYELIRFIVLGDVLTEGSVAPAILQRVADAGRRAEHAFEAASSLEGQLFLSATVGELHGIHALTEARSGAKGLDILVPATRAKARTLLLHRRVRFDERTPGSETQLMELSEQLQKAEEREELGGVAERISARSALAEAMSKKPEAYPDSVPPYPERLVARLRSHPETAFVDLTLTSAGCVCVTVLLGTDGRLKTRVQTLAIRSEEVATWLHRPTPKAPPGWLDLLADLGEVAVGERQDFERWLELAERCAAGMEGVLLQLWHRILGPVVDRLPAYGVRHLVFALSGPLAALPIAAASRMGADGRLRYLLEDFSSIRLTPSLDLWLEEDGVPMPVSPRLLVLMADPERTLPSPEKHVERIEALWEGKSASPLRLGTAFPMGQAATAEATLKGLAQADIAHLVCHGQHTMGDLEATGLRLEGDLLSASSLLKYPLPLRTRLAIVCACQSARTRTDDMGAEWMGVAGMLLRAGVREVVAALWDVHYQLSATLLECLHSGLVAGETPETALHAAMQVALEEGRRLGRTPEAAVEAPVLASLSPQHRTRMARLLPAPLFWAGFEVLAVGA